MQNNKHSISQNRTRRTSACALVLSCLWLSTTVYAQMVSTRPPVLSSPASTESMGAGDLVEIAVSYCPEMSRNYRVSTDGTLALPLLHQPLPVAGLTPSQVAQKLSVQLVAEHLLAEPIVNVSVLEYRSRPVSIVGAVNHPINFQATDHTTLIEALAKAGGLSPTAGSNIVITTQSSANQVATVRLIAVKDLIGGAKPEANLLLNGGEEIRIPEASKIFVGGNVRRPGAYPMQSDEDTTVRKAVALSLGLDIYPGAVAYIYRKRAVGTERDEVRIALRKIMTNKAPDIVLQADDILYVPTAEGKRMAAKILGQLAGFGQTAEAALVLK